MKKFVGGIFTSEKEKVARERERERMNEAFREARAHEFEQLFGPVSTATHSDDVDYRFKVSLSGLKNSYLRTGKLEDLQTVMEQYRNDKFIVIKAEVLERLQAMIDFALVINQSKSLGEYLVNHSPIANQVQAYPPLNTAAECKRFLTDLSNYPSIDKAIEIVGAKINAMQEQKPIGFNLSQEYLQSVSAYLINNKPSLEKVKHYYDGQKQERTSRAGL